MPFKFEKAPPELETQKIGRRLDPETSWDDVLERPEGPRSLPSGSQVCEADLQRVASPLLHRKDGRNAIGETIRLIRKEKGITQEELAKKASVDRTTVARIECGIFKSISVERLEGIAIAIGMDLKMLFLKASSMGEVINYRGQLSRIEFALEYPEDGFRILSHFPKQREFFFGRIVIDPHKTILSKKLPHPDQVYLHPLEGKFLLTLNQKEMFLKPGDCFAFSGSQDYGLYNPDPFKPTSSLFITHPSFLLS